MTGPVTSDTIRAALKGAGLSKIDKGILSKCTALASAHQITPAQMAECWEAFSLNKNVSELTNHTYEAYRAQLLKSCKVTQKTFDNNSSHDGAIQTRRIKREPPSNMVTPPSNKRNKSMDASADHVASDKNVVSVERKPSTRPSIVEYTERTDAGTVVESYTADKIAKLVDKVPTNQKADKCVVSSDGFQNVSKPYRYMFTSIEDRAAALESHLVHLGDAIVEKFGISDGQNGIAPLEQVNVPRQDKICCVGRICNEAHEGKLNNKSVVLEGSSARSGGARINVDLTNMKSPYSLFPGQIVAIEGHNVTGRKIAAERVCEGAAPGPCKSSVRELLEYQNDGVPLKVVTASGPFTTNDNLEYRPLIDLVLSFMEDTPDVVILMGPFVDARQEVIQTGRPMAESADLKQSVASYENLFANKISTLLSELFDKNVSTQFILIPSLDDPVARAVYPQPPLQEKSASKLMDLDLERLQNSSSSTKRVHCLSNPCTFKINEVVFGATSTDILFHMSMEEINQNLPLNTRLRRIAQHILQQQSYYPLFPPPEKFPTNLDLKHMDEWKFTCRPDILLLPSRLKTMVAPNILDSTVVINPGHLARARSGGTYAIMKIFPISRDILDEAGDDVNLPHAVNERIQVDIKRI